MWHSGACDSTCPLRSPARLGVSEGCASRRSSLAKYKPLFAGGGGGGGRECGNLCYSLLPELASGSSQRRLSCTSRVSGIFEKFTCRPKCLLWAHMVPWLLVARPAWCLLLVERACVCSSAPVLTSPSCPDSVSGQVPGSAETCLC